VGNQGAKVVSDEDSFLDNLGGDRTVVKPVPGGRRTQSSQTGRSSSESRSVSGSQNIDSFTISGEGLNPLVNASATLLSLVGALRNVGNYNNVDQLRTRVVEEIRMFERQAKSLGVTPETGLAARYALCALLDETVLNTPWGSESRWSSQSLLSTFHNETWGGEKFFQILDRVSQNPAQNLDILELMYICISLGFEGKYRVQDRGSVALTEVQDSIFRLIRSYRGEIEQDLSLHWRGVEDKRNVLVRYVPLWVVAAFSGALLLATYLGFGYVINQSSGPVMQRLSDIGNPTSGKNP